MKHLIGSWVNEIQCGVKQTGNRWGWIVKGKNRTRCSNVSHLSIGLQFDRSWLIFLPHQTTVVGVFEMLRSFLNFYSCCWVKGVPTTSIYIGLTRLDGLQVLHVFYSYFPWRWKSDGIHVDLKGIDSFPIFCRPLQDPYSRSSPGTAPETIFTKRAARVVCFFYHPYMFFLEENPLGLVNRDPGENAKRVARINLIIIQRRIHGHLIVPDRWFFFADLPSVLNGFDVHFSRVFFCPSLFFQFSPNAFISKEGVRWHKYDRGEVYSFW